MAFTKLKTTQVVFLEKYLRGTDRVISAKQAEALFGIKNIRARMTELRQCGLRVRRTKNSTGRASYAVSRRDVFGNQFHIFA